MNTIKVLFLGPAKDLAGLDSITLELSDPFTVAHLRQQLAASYPDMANAMSSIRFAVNETFAEDETALTSGDEVALIPPVSGGSNDQKTYVVLVDEPVSMALKEMHRLADEAMVRWSAGKVLIVHRTGSVGPGEVSVVISVACAHRAEAFEACRWLIDTLKESVPIWKKDIYEDGFVHWVEPPKSTESE